MIARPVTRKTTLPEESDIPPLYMGEIHGHQLLSALEERQLAERIEASKQECDKPMAVANQAVIEDGAAAKRCLVESNLRLVASIALRFAGQGVPIADLIQEGNLGLMRAAETYDARGRFSTYATWWIRQACRRALGNTDHLIRLPIYVREALSRLRRESVRLRAAGKEPSINQLAARLDMAPEKVAELLATDRLRRGMVSLDALLDEHENTRLSDVLEDASATFAETTLATLSHREQLERALLALGPRERGIIEHRYGLDGDGGATLSQVGRRFGITRERVRQIEVVALAKLRLSLGVVGPGEEEGTECAKS